MACGVLTRKIKVVGCLNCPYYAEFTDASLPLEEQEDIRQCTHPSFKRSPMINGEYVTDLQDSRERRMSVRFMPDWCPLDIDSAICYYPPTNS